MISFTPGMGGGVHMHASASLLSTHIIPSIECVHVFLLSGHKFFHLDVWAAPRFVCEALADFSYH